MKCSFEDFKMQYPDGSLKPFDRAYMVLIDAVQNTGNGGNSGKQGASGIVVLWFSYTRL
ncbi:MAG: hypothetical protein Ta2B_29330 [Termitinemataceae bacterium]|nr:MAG: hypothetical protein Ta2B_29330 [Termitinemataceae bacterium]